MRSMNPLRMNLRPALLFALPPAFALLTYALSLGNGFAMIDDGLLIFENNLIREISSSTLWTAFTSYDPELYIPLTFVSYQIDYMIGGLHPFIYHLTNLLLHAGSSLLVAACAFLLFSDRRLAVIAGVLFAVHPLHAEAVAWAAARKDVLSGFFFLLSLVTYLLYERKRLAMSDERLEIETKLTANRLSLTAPWHSISVLIFLFALLSKVTAITLPVILLLADWYLGRRDFRQMFLEKIPYFLLSLIFGLVALGGKGSLIVEQSPLETILLACKTTVFALFQIFFPLRLSVFYPELSQITLKNPPFLFFFFLVVAGACSLWLFRKQKTFIFGALFFALTLAPAFLSTVKGGNTFFFSDRYAYLPSIGVIFAAVSFLLERVRGRKLFIILGILMSVLAVRAGAEALIWGDSVRLFERSTRLYPNFYLDHINLGASLGEVGKKKEAIAEFRKAIELYPLANTYGLIGEMEAEQRHYREAVRAFGEGLAMQEDNAELHYGLGQVYALMGERDNAVASYERALELSLNEANHYRQFARRISSREDKILLRLGLLYGETGDHAKAMEYYETALFENPFNADAEYNLAVSLGNLGRTDEAIAHYERAREIDPNYIRARVNLAILYMRGGQKIEAIRELRAVLKIDPQNIAATQTLKALGVTP